MKLTRAEAMEVLGLDPLEDVSRARLDRAFRRLSRKMHPSSVAAERQDEAEAALQLITAAYQRLTDDASDREEGGNGDSEEEVEEIVPTRRRRQLEANEDGKAAERVADMLQYLLGIGQPSGDRARGSGGDRSLTIEDFALPDGSSLTLTINGVADLFSMGQESADEFSDGDDYDSEYYDSEYSEYDSDSQHSCDFCIECQRRHRRQLLLEEDRAAAAEQDRVRQQYAAAAKAQRQQQERDARWLAQLPRPARVSYSETCMLMDVDRGKHSRLAEFENEKLPECYFWQLQHRAVVPGQPLGEWEEVGVRDGRLQVEVSGLTPGTKYAFRARPCKEEAEGAGEERAPITAGEWSVQAQYATSGTRPAAAAARHASTEAAPAAAPKGQGRKGRRRAKQAGRAEGGRAAAERREP